jgi:Uma2 family endonuclease
MTLEAEWVSHVQQRIDVPRSARLRLTEHGLTLVPVSGAHKTTQNEIENQIRAKLPGWKDIGEFQVLPEREGYMPEPDVAAIRLEDYSSRASRYSEDRLPFVVEIVSRESRKRDYETKPTHYALRGIHAYLVVDVQKSTWTLYQDPEDGAYQRIEEGEFGKEIVIPVDGELMLRLDSSKFDHF